MAFTKRADDIKDPREFDYHYLLVISKFTVPTGQQQQERCYYHFEDSLLLPEAECSFSFITTFRSTDEEGNKVSLKGMHPGGTENQFKLVYLVKWAAYWKQVEKLQKTMLE